MTVEAGCVPPGRRGGRRRDVASLVRLAAMTAALFLAAAGPTGAAPPAVVRSPAAGRVAVADATASGRLRESVARAPLAFLENSGQLDSRVRYYLPGRRQSVYFTKEGVTLALTSGAFPEGKLELAGLAAGNNAVPRRHVVRLEFPGANPDLRVRAEAPAPTRVSYFKGPRERWRTGLATWGRVVYEGLWPGIDLVYEGTESRLKYRFVVAPGANPRRIHFAWSGADAVRLTEEGDLEFATSAGSFRDERPYSYQESGSGHQRVESSFRADPGDGGTFSFRLGSYDPRLPLVIDPGVLISAGFLGGSADDLGEAIAVDFSNNVYIAGTTSSTAATFPVAVGPDLVYNGGTSDGFVAKLDSGMNIVYCGYIGGSNTDLIHDIAVDFNGAVYVTGSTLSDQSSFPVLVGPSLTYSGGFDAFVAKVDPTGSNLVYCGYIGGAANDHGFNIGVDFSGNAYVVGRADSDESTFPVTRNSFDTTFNGGLTDGFVAKVSPTGANLVYCGYIGGSGNDIALGVAVYFTGEVYVVGRTTSDQASFPVAVGPSLTFGGIEDAFVAKVNAAGTALLFCGYIGGSGTDVGTHIAIDGAFPNPNAYVTGFTDSTQATFPVRVGPSLTSSGGNDAFVARVKGDGSGLDYCGYIGGSGDDRGFGIAVDSVGGAVVVGQTSSDQSTFPVRLGPDLTYNGGASDAFIAKVAPGGVRLDHCGYIGGSGNEAALGVVLDSTGVALVVGETDSTEATFPAAGPPDPTANGGLDAFVASVSTCTGFLVTTTADTVDVNPGDGICADASNNCSLRAAIMEANSGFFTGDICVPPGTYALTINDAAGDENAGATGDLDIRSGYRIYGDGPPGSVIIDAGGTAGSPRRVFDIQPGVNDPGVDLLNLTIQGGFAAGRGGGIRVQTGSLVVLGLVVIQNNQSTLSGGGIALEGSASAPNIAFSTIAGNQVSTAGEFGGGLWIDVNADATVNNSTISGNQSPAPQLRNGIAALGNLTMLNSTVSGNRASGQPGVGLYVAAGTTLVQSSTFAGNSTSSGGFEIEPAGGSVTLENSLMGGDPARNCSAAVASNQGNLDSGNTCGFAAGDLINSNPLIGALADNGGFTKTHGLLSGSPAIDAGNRSCPPPGFDQRGVNRPIGARCDSGSFEGAVSVTPTFFGPTPYLSKADSPFLANINAGRTYLETMECGSITVPGVTPSTGSVIPPGFAGLIDSVDADDGVIDGSGLNGHSFFSPNGSAGIDFTFSAAVLGALPTEAGIVWTDGSGTTTFEAFDAGGASLGLIGPVSIADGSNSGQTAEDRFFGVRYSAGISRIRISSTSGGIEVDHLQYGLYTTTSASADLSIAKSDSPDPVATGATLTYTLDVSNAGPSATCSAVTVTDLLPAGVSFLSASGAGWSCNQSAGVVTCTLPSLSVGAAPSMTIQVSAPSSPGSITNNAVVSSQTPDPVPSNNAASATTTVSGSASADVQITKTGPQTVAAGSNVVYTIAVTNNGPGSASAVSVSDATPSGLTFVSNAGACATAFPCNLGTVNNGQTLMITSTFAVPPSYAGPNPISNTASVSSATADPTPSNNTSTATTTVSGSAPPIVSIGPAIVTKPASGTIDAVFPVTMSAASAGPVQVSYATSDGTAKAGVDYQAVFSVLTIPAGATSASIAVLVYGNTIASDDKIFLVQIYSPTRATIGSGVATGTIRDRSALPSLAIGDASVSVGSVGVTPAVFTLTLSPPTGRMVSVNYQTTDGTATAADHDYLPTSGTVLFAAGETSKTVTVSVLGRDFVSTRTFFVDLSPAVNANVTRSRGVGTISRAYPSLSVGDTAVLAPGPAEPPGTAVVSVSLTPASTQTVTVSYATADRTAVAGVDYTATSGALTFAPGENTMPVSIPLLPRGTAGPPKVFTLSLSSPTNAIIFKALGDCAIYDPSKPLPPGPFLFIDDAAVSRPGSSFASFARVFVRLTGPSTAPISLSYATKDETAVAGTDYLATFGILTIEPGETSRTLLVPVLIVPPGGGSKTFKVSLADPFFGDLIPAPEATVTIEGP